MVQDVGKQQESFTFVEGYREIAEHIEAERDKEAVLAFYEMLIEYALHGNKPKIPSSDSWMGEVWKKAEGMVDKRRENPSKDDEGKSVNSAKPKKKTARFGYRSLEDLSNEELISIAEDYGKRMSYFELCAKYGIKQGTLNNTLPTKVKEILYRRNQEAAAEILTARLAGERLDTEQRWEQAIQELTKEGLTPSESEELIGLMGIGENSIAYLFTSIRRIKELMRYPSCFDISNLLAVLRESDSNYPALDQLAEKLDTPYAAAGKEPEVEDKVVAEWEEELW
ncbi:MAG: hypothetical protein VB027_06635 [Gordonibacter sp.]|nr:hypothetical protein [Gordonibacter sp.]